MSDKYKPSTEEEKYIQKAEQDARARLRQERQLAAIRQQEREGIAQALGTNEEIAAAALELGFDADTAMVLPFVPILQVAWADGSVSRAERSQLLELGARYGLADHPAGLEFLELLISERPSDTFFAKVNALMERIVKENPTDMLHKNLLDMCVAVAQASGGFFGFTDAIGKEERALLEQFASMFKAE